MTFDIVEIVVFGVGVMVQTVILLVALWIMIKIQKLDFKWHWLILAAILATLFDQIPYFGRVLAVGSLLLSLYKITGAEYIDVLFTVSVGYAVRFVLTLWLLGALMGDLTVGLRNVSETRGWSTTRTNTVVVAPPTNTVPVAPTNNVPTNGLSTDVVKRLSQNFSLKGIVNGKPELAIVSTGTRTYTVTGGDTFSMETPDGKVKVHCDQIAETNVTLNIGGLPFDLSLHQQDLGIP